MTLRALLIFAVVALVGACGTTARAAQVPRSAAVELAIAQFVDFEVNSPDAPGLHDTNEAAPGPEFAAEFERTLGADGSWPDIDYASKARSSWPPALHWARLKAMAVAARRPATPPAERERLLASVHRAFAHWIARDYTCTNWWYNEIGIPKLVGPVTLLLGPDATPEEMRYATAVSLARFPIARTGQNKIWLAGNALMRGLLLGDETRLREASDAIWSEIAVSTAEGVQPDFSFHQHGAQQQFGNYGMAFAVNLGVWARVLRGTPWRMPAEQLAVFRGYLLEGQNWVSWRGAMDISSCGRQFMPGSPRAKAAVIARVMRQAALFDPAHAAGYAAFATRNEPGAANDLVGLKHFWRSDYVVQRRPEFMATLKLSSNRVIGAELVNFENLSGFHLGDGALYLHRRGDEYEEIFPLWNWSRLPGVTCAQTPPQNYQYSQVPRDFVGALTDGRGGVAAMDFARDGVSARKAWFFLGDTIWNLGAAVAGANEAGLATTINQSRARGPVRIERGAAVEEIATAGGCELAAGAIVEHDGWRYRLLEGATARVEVADVTGHWRRVFTNPATPPEPVTGRLFTLWIDHGPRPAGDRYAYTSTLAGAAERGRLLVNSPAVQAVADDDGAVAVVFWEAGAWRLPDGRELSVDAPCLVWLRDRELRVADPTQKLARLALRLAGAAREVALPAGPMAGTSVVIDFTPGA